MFIQMSECGGPGRHRCEEQLALLSPSRKPSLDHTVMKYILLVHESSESLNQVKTPADVAAGRAYGEALMAAGIFIGGAGLEPPAMTTTVSVRDGKRQVHDGPYAETKEFLAGFALIDVPDLDVALSWAARHPSAGRSKIEVRPLAGSYFVVGTK
jgi:hypothetical protein